MNKILVSVCRGTKEQDVCLPDNAENRRLIKSVIDTANGVKPRQREWTDQDDRQLIDLRQRGLPVKHISKFLDRSPVAINSRIYKLRLSGVVIERISQ